jgi:hypothetical protein
VSDNAKTWIGFLVGAGVSAYVLYYGFSLIATEENPWWLAKVYKVSTDQVHVNKKPIDCDFHYAPVGYKGCQYKAVVKTYDKEGWLVGGDGAPRYSHDAKTGKPIESDDDGKTWERIDEILDDVPDPKVTSVVVSWVKVTD